MNEELVTSSSFITEAVPEGDSSNSNEAAQDIDLGDEHIIFDPLMLNLKNEAANEEDDFKMIETVDKESENSSNYDNDDLDFKFDTSDTDEEMPDSNLQDSEDYTPVKKEEMRSGRKQSAKDSFETSSTSHDSSDKPESSKQLVFYKFFQIVQKLEGNGIEVICKICKKHFRGSAKIKSNFVRHLKQRHKEDYECYVKLNEKISTLRTEEKIASRSKLKAEREDFKSILFNKYFTVVKKISGGRYPRAGGIEVSCNMCKRHFKGYGRVSSNFTRHLRQKHETAYVDYKKAKSYESQSLCMQDTFNKLVVRFLVEDMLPISTVSSDGFKQLIAFTSPRLAMTSPSNAVSILNSAYLSMFNNTQNSIRANDYFCTTVDIWSIRNNNFLGCTLHWIDEGFQRQSVALACKRLTGPQSIDSIRNLIYQIHAEHELSPKNVQAIITDNATNFIQSFNEFRIYTDCGDVETKELHFGGIPSDVFNFHLPKTLRCATHTLNLVASKNFLSILKNNNMYKKHQKIMEKCSCLWQRINDSSITEQVKSFLGCQLKYPVATEWNSLFNSLKDVLEHQDEVNRLMEALQEEPFTEVEFKCLQIYLDLLSPIAEAIDFLQSNQEMVYGFLLPTLARTRSKYFIMIEDYSQKVKSDLAAYMLKAVEQRFLDYFNLTEDVNDAIIASVLCPQAKTKWIKSLNPNIDESKINAIVLMAMKAVAPESVEDPVQDKAADFFNFGANLTTRSQSDVEFSAYLSDNNISFNMLNKYALVKAAFLKYNAPIPASISVERLFSFPNLINSSRGDLFSDSNFEKLILLKANSFLK